MIHVRHLVLFGNSIGSGFAEAPKWVIWRMSVYLMFKKATPRGKRRVPNKPGQKARMLFSTYGFRVMSRLAGNFPATDPVQELSWFARSNCTPLAELKQRSGKLGGTVRWLPAVPIVK